MRKFTLPLLSLLLALLLIVPSTHAQDPYTTDADGDGVVDAFDACPTEAGADFNYGCPEGVVPPDADADTFPDVIDLCPNAAGFSSGCPDTDNDGIDDGYDVCPDQPGVYQNYGCSLDVPRDGDRDGILDIVDRCPYLAGIAERNGCPEDYNDDIDFDGVPDYQDSCIDEANPGPADNAGCAAGVTPDMDFDGVPDAQDACPVEYGDMANGCWEDADNDFIPTDNDACPDQAGNSSNFGCPDGVLPPDTDGDGSLDLYDRCPTVAGANGFDCPDGDGDVVPDIDDLCPDVAGDMALGGCLAKNDATLNPNRATITAANAGNLVVLDTLVRPAFEYELGNNNIFAVLSWEQPLITYDLSQPTFAPVGVLETQSGQMQMSADGSILVEITYGENGTPAVRFWDPVAAVAAYIELTDFVSVTSVAISDNGETIAIGTGDEPFSIPVEAPMVQLFGRDGSPLGQLSNLPTAPQQLALAPDGSWLAVGGPEGTFVLSLPDGTVLGTLPSSPFFLGFDGIDASPDGSMIATTNDTNGTISVYSTADFSLRFEVETLGFTQFDAAQSVRFSPDGTLLVVTGGAFFDGMPPEDARNQLSVIDVSSSSIVFQVETQSYFPSFAAFSGDMRTLAVGYYNFVEFYGVQ